MSTTVSILWYCSVIHNCSTERCTITTMKMKSFIKLLEQVCDNIRQRTDLKAEIRLSTSSSLELRKGFKSSRYCTKQPKPMKGERGQITNHHLFLLGPTTINPSMIDSLYKYDSGGKHFNRIPTKTLSVSIDAITIQNSIWNRSRRWHNIAPKGWLNSFYKRALPQSQSFTTAQHS